ncbi:sucrose-phosphatase-like HAD superfamily hydrolase [Reticulomyxa filosa]|uniref:Sucrose-phosphatase-like HAD superfamily hydrolase n=1 Tax=Reticulomyxa filosa TaxID=46433 RepID=X6MYK7_RETFI|nr:sucrose-phosphatase-like HAD superfamily hydrolase [Reticulomyxa filosa]|eukprot:ETO18871.1 sucrose-phosphatase-like HAD superfamily hydrolase [Reticulomyxa filosa]
MKSRLTKYGETKLDEVHHTFPLKLPPKLVLVTDLDFTLFGISPNETLEQAQSYLREFNKLWCSKYAPNNCVLIYATGRSLPKYETALNEYTELLKPDILICKDGVDIHWFNKHLAQLVQAQSTRQIDLDFDDEMEHHEFEWFDRSWEATLKQGWDQEFAESLHHEWKKTHKMPELPPGSNYLEQFRVAVMTFSMEEAMEAKDFFIKRVEEYNRQIETELSFEKKKRKKYAMNPSERKNSKKHRMEIHAFYCIERSTSHWWAALCPARAGKGCAVDWVRQRLHCETGENFIVCGDSGNDISMLSLPKYHAVIVKNCSRELQDYYEAHGELKGKYIYLANKNITCGVMEGLEYFSTRISQDWGIDQ